MVAQGQYPQYWEADVVLRDGATAHVRPIAPSDADAVQAFHSAQSQNSIYMRFFTYKSKLTSRELKRFTSVDYRDRAAFVITRGADIIGIGRYDRLEDPRQAEVAFNIADQHQGRGLGSILLEHLAAAAREHGIRQFTAEVLPSNRKMLDVFSEAGYEVERHFDDGVVALHFNIDPTERSRTVMAAREHRAEARSVADLLTPSSIAVIGASRRAGTVGYELLQHIVDGGFRGPVSAVNPEAFELAGVASYANIVEVPGPVQLAIIAVPYAEVAAVVQQCATAGVQGILVATAGYADDGEQGARRQRELVRQARANGMRLIGPASLGMINTDPFVSLNASMAPTLPPPGGLGLFCQSAAVGVLLYAAASRRGVGLSTFLSAGNRADVSGNDLMQYWEDDPGTRAVGMYLESIGNPRKFSRIARRLSRSKPVIVAKSDVMGLRVPPGHLVRTTQAPGGALDAMLRQAGVIRVETTEQLLDVAQILVSSPLPKGPSLAVFSNSLALGKVVADSAEAHELTVGRLVTDVSLESEWPESEPGSPGSEPEFTESPAALAQLRRRLLTTLHSAEVSAAVAALLPVPGVSVEELSAVLRDCAVQSGKPVIAAFTGILEPGVQLDRLVQPPPGGDPPAAEAGLSDVASTVMGDGQGEPAQFGLPCFSSPGAAVAALAAVVRYAQWVQRDQGEVVHPSGISYEPAGALVETLLKRTAGAELIKPEPDEVRALLGYYGIDVLPSVPFDTSDEAVAAAAELGWPVAIKTMDENLRHRLDLGGVRLNIGSADSLRRNIEQMRRTLLPYGDFSLEVQHMAQPGQACTLRAIEDPLLGPVISFGLAGDAVDLLEDWAHRIPPLTTADVADVVRSPRAARKLFGYQGLPPVHIEALTELIGRLAVLKDEHPELALIALNPVLVSEAGLSVLSAEVQVGNPAQRTDSARRALRN